MADGNELDCKLFVETPLEQDALAKCLAESLSASLSGAATSWTVQAPGAEIELRNNPEADQMLAQAFPDGFLSFRYALEVYPAPATRREERIALTTRLLLLFWAQGFPAVAACDYEEELPFAGGYNQRSAPWTTPELLPR